MKFLADENIGFSVITSLRKLGYDITSILESNRGIKDTEVLVIANKENRIIITSDTDFGELIFLQKLVHSGIELLRLKDSTSQNKLNVLQNLLANFPNELKGAFTVVRENQIRIRTIK